MITCDCKQAKHVHGHYLMRKTHKCDCGPCVQALRENRAQYQDGVSKLVDATPSHDLVNALLADGYVAQWLSIRIAGNKSYVQQLMRAKLISRPRAARIEAVYAELMSIDRVDASMECGHLVGSGGWVKDHMGISRYRCKECATELMGVAE